MKKVFDLDADIELGDNDKIDWRKETDEIDPDDEQLDETPEDVITILGFDPIDLFKTPINKD